MKVDPVLVEVYYESMCPDSKYFIRQQLVPAVAKVSQIMNFVLKPYGKAQVQLYISLLLMNKMYFILNTFVLSCRLFKMRVVSTLLASTEKWNAKAIKSMHVPLNM